MKIYKLEQDDCRGYDTYDSAIVVAEDEEAAKRMSPDDRYFWKEEEQRWAETDYEDPDPELRWTRRDWTSNLALIKVTLCGEASPGIPRGVLLASFNAG